MEIPTTTITTTNPAADTSFEYIFVSDVLYRVSLKIEIKYESKAAKRND